MRIGELLKVALFSIVNLTVTLAISAQDYSLSAISPEMIKNADAVMRLSNETVLIKSVSSATATYKYVITILNEEARNFSIYFGSTDKFSTCNFGKLIIYDQTGKKVKSFGSSHVKPVSVNSISVYDDSYYFTLDPDYRTYPFTVELEYSKDYKGIFILPPWYYHSGYNLSTEKEIFTVITPSDYKLKYYERSNPAHVQITKNENQIKYSWETENVQALTKEPLSVSLYQHTPSVYLAPADFEIGGKRGNSETWESFGFFRTSLIKGRDIIEGPTSDSVRTLIKNITDTTEMVKRIYKYMQNRTRYVSVQDGIGGWQPIEAQNVDKKHYGDCKGLTNYTKALLGTVGIKSIYTVARAGDFEDDIFTAFPSNQTNHAILCVPRGADTIWLECTDQRKPFNYLGSFTDDRHVLLITESGGKLVRTPKYSAEQNCQLRKAYVTLDATGNGNAEVLTKYYYYFFDEAYKLLYLDQAGRKKVITNSIEIPAFTLANFTFTQPYQDKPEIDESLSLKVDKYGTVMGDRILLPVNLMNRIERLPSNAADRKMDIEFKRDLMLIDSITYKIPIGYLVTSVPQPIEYSSPFGKYRAEIILNGKEVTYIRQMRYNKGIYPASQYQQLLDFYKNIATADNIKLALKRM